MYETERSNRSLVIGLIVVIAVIVVAVLAYPALTDDDDNDVEDVANEVDEAAEDTGEAVEEAAEDTGDAVEEAAEDTGEAVEDTAAGIAADLQVDELVAATEVGDDNCAEETTDTFSADQPVYVIASGADVPEGASMYVRIVQNDQPVTETQPINVAQGAQDTCLAFLITPEGGTPLAAGEYEAQLMINDTEADSVSFQVEDSTATG